MLIILVIVVVLAGALAAFIGLNVEDGTPIGHLFLNFGSILTIFILTFFFSSLSITNSGLQQKSKMKMHVVSTLLSMSWFLAWVIMGAFQRFRGYTDFEKTGKYWSFFTLFTGIHNKDDGLFHKALIYNALIFAMFALLVYLMKLYIHYEKIIDPNSQVGIEFHKNLGNVATPFEIGLLVLGVVLFIIHLLDENLSNNYNPRFVWLFPIFLGLWTSVTVSIALTNT